MTEEPRYLLAAHNDALAQEGRAPRFFVRNYGCQMNERDAEKLRALLSQLGYAQTKTQEDADFILYNTCCVRKSAEDKIFGHLSRVKTAKAANKGLFVVVCGCMTQQPDIAQVFRKHPYVNVVCGTANRHRLPEFIWQAMETGAQVIDINEDEGLPELTGVPVTTREYPHKAGVNIMYGCDNYCAFCIVPYVRGREKSRPAADILEEARALAADGVKEIMLLGQNVNAYGKNDKAGEGAFADLLRQVHDIPGLARIRFMTSHPKDFSGALIAAMAELPRVCKSVHLPLQSGSTRVLADMNRQYTQEDYLALTRRLQGAIPDIAITTDIIVGYPGETEEDFEATLAVARQVGFAGAFTFIYSQRSGTPAASRTDTVPRKTANERFERLTATLYPIMEARNQQLVGRTVETMVEEQGKGRTGDNTLVHFTSEKAAYAIGDLIPVRVHTARSFYVKGISSL
ncbi:MAG: tRNA (N6-isopentenyl adenosine(37)-C2)-methylthiotransferase MiaB [Defluviitaleaceae bacterium]|nr:tRNA (N6-isopentenyl adenosine(37)-C2)-methylthiotransferase MiaB [Defluviitaleaceae bacterium]MCL2238644.1 tRNA (N6-isopentenyl adenosine(37)-C2)-methylthiotransferase MiaB [Defluviitaleaceae bacterium]